MLESLSRNSSHYEAKSKKDRGPFFTSSEMHKKAIRMRHALEIDILFLKCAKTTQRRQTHKIDTIIARLACSTDSVCV